MKHLILIALLLILSSAHAKQSTSYFDHTTQVAENIWIGPQPSQQDLLEFKDAGINNVIQVGTAKERKTLKFNEAHQLNHLGIGFNSFDLGRRHTHSPQKLTAFNDLLLPQSGNKIIIHSKNYTRARHLVAAWMIKYQEAIIDDAMKAVELRAVLVPDDVMLLLGYH